MLRVVDTIGVSPDQALRAYGASVDGEHLEEMEHGLVSPELESIRARLRQELLAALLAGELVAFGDDGRGYGQVDRESLESSIDWAAASAGVWRDIRVRQTLPNEPGPAALRRDTNVTLEKKRFDDCCVAWLIDLWPTRPDLSKPEWREKAERELGGKSSDERWPKVWRKAAVTHPGMTRRGPKSKTLKRNKNN
jgi:hypothetical protein